jgi:hypothetical protein
MNPALIISVIEGLLSLAPKLPAVVAAVETTIGLINSGAAPTPEQQAQIDDFLELAHSTLQADAKA